MFNKILAPLDGSNLSECTFDHIKEIATGCHISKVVLLTVLEPTTTPGDWWTNRQQIEEMGAELIRRDRQIQDNADAYLARATDKLKEAGLEVESVTIKEAGLHKEAEVILDYAENNNIDLIVMSTHGRSGPARWAMGSVADEVVRHSRSPVLTINPLGCKLSR
jgi:nucleotide-binding universal stress UspA family protein